MDPGLFRFVKKRIGHRGRPSESLTIMDRGKSRKPVPNLQGKIVKFLLTYSTYFSLSGGGGGGVCVCVNHS